MKDSDAWAAEIQRAPHGAPVTADDLDVDAQQFMAFASAFGVKPPVPGPDEDPVLESAGDATEG